MCLPRIENNTFEDSIVKDVRNPFRLKKRRKRLKTKKPDALEPFSN